MICSGVHDAVMGLLDTEWSVSGGPSSFKQFERHDNGLDWQISGATAVLISVVIAPSLTLPGGRVYDLG
jgi:hypothetical protein